MVSEMEDNLECMRVVQNAFSRFEILGDYLSLEGKKNLLKKIFHDLGADEYLSYLK